MAQHVSMARYEEVQQKLQRATTRAREIKAGAGGYRAGAATLAGTAIAAVIDEKVGEGRSLYVAVAAGVAGVAMGNTDLVNAGTGLAAPSLYIAIRAQLQKMAAQAAQTTGNAPATA